MVGKDSRGTGEVPPILRSLARSPVSMLLHAGRWALDADDIFCESLDANRAVVDDDRR